MVTPRTVLIAGGSLAILLATILWAHPVDETSSMASPDARASGEVSDPATSSSTELKLAANVGFFPRLEVTSRAEVREVLSYTRHATAEESPELRRAALSSPDPLVVGNALLALGRLGELGSDPRLAALASDERPRVRQDLAIALGIEAKAASVDLLAPMLDSADDRMRPLVLRSLGQVGGERARRVLADFLPRAGNATDLGFAKSALAAASRKPVGK